MAIINTLAQCLESPYLVQDREAPARVPGLLRTAADRLEGASNLHRANAKEQADITFLAYEAMFACLRALVSARGYREYGLRCLLLACEEFYVRPGLLDAALVHTYERAQGLKTPPAEALDAASRLVKRTLELLGADPPNAAGDGAAVASPVGAGA